MEWETDSRIKPKPSSKPVCWPQNKALKSSPFGINRIANTTSSAPSPPVSAAAADNAVRSLVDEAYHVDADHINFETVDRFLEASDFYTIDVADWIGKPAAPPK